MGKMTGLFRKTLFVGASAICVLSALFWIVSLERGISVVWVRSQPGSIGELYQVYMLTSSRGGLSFHIKRVTISPDDHISAQEVQAFQHDYPLGVKIKSFNVSEYPFTSTPDGHRVLLRFFGFEFRNIRGRNWGSSYHTVAVVFPYWIVTFLTALPSASCLATSFRRRHRFHHGLCPHCGYDLRATPERCPECGYSRTS
jgi:hypothetical protein